MIVEPDEALSPKDRLSNLQVVHNGGPGEASIARGTWDGVPSEILIRWNGTEEKPLGYPSNRGYATWHVLPRDLLDLIVQEANRT